MRAVVVACLVAATLAAPAHAAGILVFAAASLTDALGEIGTAWSSASGDEVAFSFGGSSTLARQIEEGAPADLFVSADAAKVDALAGRGGILAGSRRELLSNRLVIVVAAADGARIASAADLATSRVKLLALAEPQTVPAGIYARAYLERAGLWPQVSRKVVPTDNVRAALAAVEAGNADAAIVYATDARISRRVRAAVEISAADAPRIVYVAAVPAKAPHPEAAQRFLEHLASPRAAAVFARYGFLPPAPAPPAP